MDSIQGLGYYGLNKQQNQSLLSPLADPLQGQNGQSASSLRRDIQQRVDEILSGVEPDANGKITMDGLIAKKDELIASFEEGVKADLVALGVDPDVEFTLAHDERSNTLSASSNHPQADVVKQYFRDHPERADEFAQIRMMSRVADMAQNPVPSMEFRKQMQLQFAGEMASQGYLAGSPMHLGFSGAGATPLMGLSMMV